ncbi:hypothetical protein AJ80_01141 [Polytolypa hystricis UAMH7299]|uniref:Uncharacterized protein n=1 Tax=Polytolypa hystricis (strain UAMH7299) TaxID=1447883 RepID=A0A2B7YT18_POLH7|nr:hypothetical protein AJ80_01141 [Polytolypa hystricis UAMH7299]
MAANGYDSPFPTSHDTLGASSLNTPLFTPSAPSRMMQSHYDSIITQSKKPSSARGRKSHPNTTTNNTNTARRSHSIDGGSESDANLSDYTFDLSKLSDEEEFDPAKEDATGREAARQRKLVKHVRNESMSEIGGPRDFTLNMVELMNGTTGARGENDDKGEGDEEGEEEREEEDENEEEEKPKESHNAQNEGVSRQNLDENTEFDPPIDMSTPAHFLARRRDLADVEEEDEEEIERTHLPRGNLPETEPSKSVLEAGQRDHSECMEIQQRLREELRRLQEEMRSKDETIKIFKVRVLDSAGNAQQVRQLQSELENKNTLLRERGRELSDQAVEQSNLQSSLVRLQSQVQEKDVLLLQKERQLSEQAVQLSDLRRLQSQLEENNILLQEKDDRLSEEAVQRDRLQSQLEEKDTLLLEKKRQLSEHVVQQSNLARVESQLEEKDILLQEKEDRLAEQAEQQDRLQSQLDDKIEELNHYKVDGSRLESLQREVELLRKQVADSKALSDREASDIEEALQQQFRQKDAASREASAEMSAAIAAMDFELKEKLDELHQLKVGKDEHSHRADRLASEREAEARKCADVEERYATLLQNVQHLENQNTSLRSQMQLESESRHEAIRKLAVDLSIHVESNYDFWQIVNSFRSANFTKPEENLPASSPADSENQQKIQTLGQELSEVCDELQKSISTNRVQALELESVQQQLNSSKSLVTLLQEETKRMASRLETVTSSESTLQERVSILTQECDEGLRTIEQLRAEQQQRKQRKIIPIQTDRTALTRVHEAELASLQAAHETAITTLQDSHEETTRSIKTMLDAARNRETEMDSQLRELREREVALERRVASLITERERLEAIIEAKVAAGHAMDSKFASMLRKRDETWQRRIDRIFTDREQMGKVMMWSWGENEVGRVLEYNLNGGGGGGGDCTATVAAGGGSTEGTVRRVTWSGRTQGYVCKYMAKDGDGDGDRDGAVQE